MLAEHDRWQGQRRQERPRAVRHPVRTVPPVRLRVAGAAAEVEQVPVFGLVECECECFRDRVEKGVRRPQGSTLLEPLVVIGAESGEGGDLLAPEPGDLPSGPGSSPRSSGRVRSRRERRNVPSSRAARAPNASASIISVCRLGASSGSPCRTQAAQNSDARASSSYCPHEGRSERVASPRHNQPQ